MGKGFTGLQKIEGVHTLLQSSQGGVDGAQGLQVLGRSADGSCYLGKVAFNQLLPGSRIALSKAFGAGTFFLPGQPGGRCSLPVKIVGTKVHFTASLPLFLLYIIPQNRKKVNLGKKAPNALTMGYFLAKLTLSRKAKNTKERKKWKKKY